MGESVKAVLSLLVVIGVFGSWFAWSNEGRKSFSQYIWLVRLGLPVLGLAALTILLWAVFRRDKLPDKLREITRRHLECDGLSFTVIPEVKERVCWLRFYYQNRYERPCRARLLIRPARDFIKVKRPRDLKQVEVVIECEGGGFGSMVVPYAVPADRQGKSVRFNVGGATKYPDGRGKLLRFREGVRVLPPKGIADYLVTGLAALAGEIHISGEASFSMTFPRDVAEEVGEAQRPTG